MPFFVRVPFLCSANDLLYFVISNTLRSITETTKLLTFYHCVDDFSSIFDEKKLFFCSLIDLNLVKLKRKIQKNLQKIQVTKCSLKTKKSTATTKNSD